MSHDRGAYLGGVCDRKSLMDRCHVDPDTGCWHWRLSFSQHSPRVHVRLPDGKSTVMRGRAAAIYIGRGERVPKGKRAIPANHCKAYDCVSPAHAKVGTPAQLGAWIAEHGLLKGSPSRIAANRRIGQANRKLTPEQVEQARTSTESTYALAREFGVAQNTVWSARRGLSHNDLSRPVRGASVFSLGGA